MPESSAACSVTRPIVPPPSTTARLTGSRDSPSRTACTPLGSGSTSAPVRAETPSGSGRTSAAGTRTRSAKAPGAWTPMSTRSAHRLVWPSRHSAHLPQPLSGLTVTRAPSSSSAPGPPATTTPANSWPITSGGVRLPMRRRWPSISDPQIPTASGRRISSPASGSGGSGRSSIAIRSGPCHTIALIESALPGQRERKCGGGGEVDRRLDRLPRPDVVDEAAAVAGERAIAAAVAVAALVEELAEAVGEQRAVVGAVDDRADQRAPGQVGDDVLRAAREAAPDADHQRDAPRVGAQHPVALRGREAVVAPVSRQLLVERGGGDEPEAVGGGVEVVVDHAGTERVAACPLDAAGELGAEVGEQPRLADRHRELPAHADQLGVSDRADVVEVERAVA